jgi:hypothetical protein
MRQLLLLGALALAGLGAYRAFKHGSGKRRLWGLVPIVLVLLAGIFVPLVFGISQGLGAQPSAGSLAGGELLVLLIGVPLVLAALSGVLLAISFRPGRS